VAATASVVLKPTDKPPEVTTETPPVVPDPDPLETEVGGDGFQPGPFADPTESEDGSAGAAKADQDDSEPDTPDQRGVVRDETASARGKKILGGLDRIVVETEVNPQDVRGAFRTMVNGIAEKQVESARLQNVDKGSAKLNIQMTIKAANNRSIFGLQAAVSVEDTESGAIARVWEREEEEVGRVSKLMLSRGTVPAEVQQGVEDFFRVLRKDIASAGRSH